MMADLNHMNAATGESTPFPKELTNPVFCCRLGPASTLYRGADIPDNQKLPLEAFIRLTQQNEINVVPQNYMMDSLSRVTALMQVIAAAETETGDLVIMSNRFFAQPPRFGESEREEFFEFSIKEADIPSRLIKMERLHTIIVCDQRDIAHPMFKYKVQIWGTEEGAVLNGAEKWMKEVRDGLNEGAKAKLKQALILANLEAQRQAKEKVSSRKFDHDTVEIISADSRGKPVVKVMTKEEFKKYMRGK